MVTFLGAFFLIPSNVLTIGHRHLRRRRRKSVFKPELRSAEDQGRLINFILNLADDGFESVHIEYMHYTNFAGQNEYKFYITCFFGQGTPDVDERVGHFTYAVSKLFKMKAIPCQNLVLDTCTLVCAIMMHKTWCR